MEVMYDGSVLLCDDDAVGRKKFGNVLKRVLKRFGIINY